MQRVQGKTKYLLGLQHLLAMFGATVLVPFQTGMDPTLALLGAGVGTLVFHLITGAQVPVFLGSSFAFIGAVHLVLLDQGLEAVKGAVIVTGLIYIIFAMIIKKVGVQRVQQLFPPIVNGSIIILIGIRLSGVALSMVGLHAGESVDWLALLIAASATITMIVAITVGHSFFKLIPILLAIVIGFATAIVVDLFFNTHFVSMDRVIEAPWFSLTGETFRSLVTIPRFDISAILVIAPIALVVFIEHIGDMNTNGNVVGKNFIENPGIHRTMFGDGLASLTAGILGAPPNTTYSENTGVLAMTKVYDPSVIRLAAVYTIILSLIGKFGALIQSIPIPVMGGISIILFGSIAAMGAKTLAKAEIDFAHPRNLVITAVILILGTGIDQIAITSTVSISGLAVAGILGVLFNLILPKEY
ncbi:solute carrier family 23 protein [Entomospira entomophila]|uniref:Purine/pyrimidine permease n=1 Tax=Entomospira entomophila TaxID=2719988 RepID=A0A968G867_9SPIO|nr:solute carrier family 23 protein [Entomospira entomophilus]NIZ40362.1 purine/pyrimidine permease [Entomospira entomophilus]WDI35921.1 solute carrier family 23 protein [Entomospira entomophilus]